MKKAVKRKTNPVPHVKKTQVGQGMKLFSDFTGSKGKLVTVSKPDMPNVALVVGYLDAVMYETIRDGKPEKYIHKFKKKSRPLLASSYDGKQLLVLGGGYDFTDRGIVDK